jgi:hypothetical protein
MQRIPAITLILLEKLRVNLPEYFITCQEMQDVEVPNFPMCCYVPFYLDFNKVKALRNFWISTYKLTQFREFQFGRYIYFKQVQ